MCRGAPRDAGRARSGTSGPPIASLAGQRKNTLGGRIEEHDGWLSSTVMTVMADWMMLTSRSLSSRSCCCACVCDVVCSSTTE